MALQQGFHWKPSQSLTYYNAYYGDLEAGEFPAEGAKILSKDQYYGGSPYVTSTGGTVYNFLHYADANGIEHTHYFTYSGENSAGGGYAKDHSHALRRGGGSL